MKKQVIWVASVLFSTSCLASVHVSGISIDNFHEVLTGKIYRGARPEDSGIKALAQAGIKTVIDLQGGDTIFGIATEAGESPEDIAEESQVTRQNGMTFISKSLSAINPDFDDQKQEIEEILNLVSDPAIQPVYFHCRHGSDRTGLIGALYRVLYQGCTPKQAHDEMMQDGHSFLMPWIDDYFEDRVARDSRTHTAVPSAACPLPLSQ